MNASLHRRYLPMRLSVSRLRWVLAGMLLALALPSTVLVLHTQQQIKWEALFQYRTLAEELTQRIDQQLQRWIAREAARSTTEYQFLIATGNPQQPGYLQRSSLSQWPQPDAIPGLVGYFQVNESGALESPLLPGTGTDPQRWGIDPVTLLQRQNAVTRLHDILSANRLAQYNRQEDVASSSTADQAFTDLEDGAAEPRNLPESATRAAPAPTAVAADSVAASRERSVAANVSPYSEVQQNFDRLNAPARMAPAQQSLGKLDELKLEKKFSETDKKQQANREALPFKGAAEIKSAPRTEYEPVLPKQKNAKLDADLPRPMPVHLFESAVDPFEFARLESGHVLLYRKVWRDGKRLVQGLLLDESAFFDGLFQTAFQPTALAQMSNLLIAFQGDVIRILNGNEDYRRALGISSVSDMRGTLLLQQRLSAPFSDLQLLYSANHLPDGAGGRFVSWIGAALLFLLVLVFGFLYRLGLHQIRLTQQQQDFVSSVSHELKTPLTSIRMFSEMLREGWVSADKQAEYYNFICDESERLSRLITNVLQLARMERRELQLDIKPISLTTVSDLVRSRIQTQVERSGFVVQYAVPAPDSTAAVLADADALVQIVLNLVDNALKFSAAAQCKQIDISVAVQGRQALVSVRDYGPGIPAGQAQKIFELFYRVGSELTRETQGTGIGLALVQQLTRAMAGAVSVQACSPGAEFRILLPLA